MEITLFNDGEARRQQRNLTGVQRRNNSKTREGVIVNSFIRGEYEPEPLSLNLNDTKDSLIISDTVKLPKQLKENQTTPEKSILPISGIAVGIMGIIAGRLKDKYNLPSCVATRCDGIINGSGRSIPGVDLGRIIHDALGAGIITEGGGHAAAAGFSLNADNEARFCEFLEDAVRELERYSDRTDLDENRFEEVDARVSLYFNAARKFHTLPETLYEKFEETTQKLNALQQNLDFEQLEKEEKVAHDAYRSAAKALSKKRHQAAKALSEKVTDAMQMLSMSGGKFEASLIQSDPSATGLERCEFLVAGHTGVAPRPLSKVASGGELSRISLAISVITSKETPVDTLIFDEVDAGIGGAVADVVGKLLKKLSFERQVMCVTHLPQVASYGQTHLKVQKSDEGGETVSRLTQLTDAERVEELARMLAGADVTAKARANANELLENAAAYQG